MLGEAIILPSLIISIAYQECWEYVVMNGDKIGIISQKSLPIKTINIPNGTRLYFGYNFCLELKLRVLGHRNVQ